MLAILYVVLTSQFPRSILIDEPQSFLHPGAVRKLLEILQEFPQHQYIVTTHSPTALSAVDTKALYLVRKPNAESLVERLNVSAAADQNQLLAAVGARLSDVFGADNILWVEGQTEERAFPLIVHRILRRPLLGTAVLAVIQTGDFETKDTQRVIDIYRRLSQGSALLPPALAFLFDREERSQQQIDDLRRLGNVRFLNRRMYENYLIDTEATASVINEINRFSGTNVIQPITLDTWIASHRWDKKIWVSKKKQVDDFEYWITDCHGANVLSLLFQEYSLPGIRYDKVRDGLALTNWLVDNKPAQLTEVSEILAAIIASKNQN